jgi:hypothetical protein
MIRVAIRHEYGGHCGTAVNFLNPDHFMIESGDALMIVGPKIDMTDPTRAKKTIITATALHHSVIFLRTPDIYRNSVLYNRRHVRRE